jgi:hypothetical protein
MKGCRGKFRRAFSVTEALTASTVLVFVLSGVFAVGIGSAREWASDTSRMVSDNDASLAIQTLSKDVQAGLSASVGTAGSSLTIVLPLVNAQGDYDRYLNGNTVTYTHDATAQLLYRRVNGGTAQAIARRVTSVQFALNGQRVTFILHSRKQVGPKVSTTVLTTEVYLRNTPTA